MKQLLFFIYTGITTWATGFVVFERGASPWYFLLAIFMIMLYTGLSTEPVERKGDE